MSRFEGLGQLKGLFVGHPFVAKLKDVFKDIYRVYHLCRLHPVNHYFMKKKNEPPVRGGGRKTVCKNADSVKLA